MKKIILRPPKADADGKRQIKLKINLQRNGQEGQPDQAITVFKPRIVKTVHEDGIINMEFRELVARIRAGGQIT